MKKELLEAFKNVKSFSRKAAFEAEPKLEGIGFRYKTVQYHLIDDFFEEIKKSKEVFGDVDILSERFSLPGIGIENEELKRDEYQFEIVIDIEDKTDRVTYYKELMKAADVIEKKHNLKIFIEPFEESYLTNKITFHTDKEGVFSEE